MFRRPKRKVDDVITKKRRVSNRAITVRLHAAQSEFRKSESRLKAFVGGVGAGKSWVGAYDLLMRAKPNRTYGVFACTYRMLSDASWSTLLMVARELGVYGSERRSENALMLCNGAKILGRSTEKPDALRGPSLSGIWLDEASYMSVDAYHVALGRLREGGEQGWLTSTFTPNGTKHWTFKAFTEHPEAVLIRAKTSANPFNESRFAERLAAIYTPLQARQELDGEFLEMEGAEFPGSYFPLSIYPATWPHAFEVGVVAVDPSKGRDSKHGDYSAIVFVGLSGGLLYVDASLSQTRRPQDLVAETIEMATRYNVQAVTVETNQFQELLLPEFQRQAQELNLLPLPLVSMVNTQNKEVRIRRLNPYLARQQMRFRPESRDVALLVEQLQEFPVGKHDDGPDALEMAIRTLTEMQRSRHFSQQDILEEVL